MEFLWIGISVGLAIYLLRVRDLTRLGRRRRTREQLIQAVLVEIDSARPAAGAVAGELSGEDPMARVRHLLRADSHPIGGLTGALTKPDALANPRLLALLAELERLDASA